MFDLCVCVSEVENMEENTRPQENALKNVFGFFFYIFFFFITLRSYSSFSARCSCALRFPCLRAVIVEFAFNNKLTFFKLLLNTVRINRLQEPEGKVPRACARLCVSLYLAEWKCATTTCYARRRSCFCCGIHLKRIGVPIWNRLITWCRPIVTFAIVSNSRSH